MLVRRYDGLHVQGRSVYTDKVYNLTHIKYIMQAFTNRFSLNSLGNDMQSLKEYFWRENMLTEKNYEAYSQILHEELVPAMGCTEPIALAYAAAVARDILGAKPERIIVKVSGSILKNIKSVIVPNTHGLKGISASVAAGAAAGKAEKKLEVINSGSGNQGLTCSLPVIEYAKELNVSHEKLLRALTLSNLITIHQKTGIDTLSAFCGAVCAGVGAGAGILGYKMYMNGQQFYSGDGIVIGDVESIIKNVGLIGREGMKQTNEEIINLMVSDC